MASRVRLDQGGIDRVFAEHNKARAEVLGKRMVSRARRNLDEAQVHDTGKLRRSIDYKVVPQFGAKVLLVVYAIRRSADGADVAYIVHEGHKEITPVPGRVGRNGRPPALQFKPGKKFAAPGGVAKKRGGYIYVASTRAVGGVPYLSDALTEVMTGEVGLKRIIIHSSPNRAPKPHTIRFSGPRKGRRR